ncbi:hypothetical protein Y032_0015g2716 [Ancylostoma ceylanicum]|uniref:Uncharacterized protein n=1 Tax=Ancylostoma ceylanicum TaxID=53326 RepID=A0A016V8I3_9BILA|nr:hypothetical protein Y032_0015g2716 [Ancylostoma ceylanicum]
MMMVTCVSSTSTQATGWRRSRSELEVTPVSLDLLGGVEHLLTLPARSIHLGSLCLLRPLVTWVGWILPLVLFCIFVFILCGP